MKKKIISILGTGDYKESKHYYHDDYIATSKYVQLVLYEIYCQEFNEDDEFIVFLTNESKEMHWDLKLELEIQELLRKTPLQPKVKAIVLDYKDKDYTKKLYTNMIDIIDVGDEVILDITHGFRSYTILISSILDYVRVVKDVNVKNVVYGEYNSESKVTEIKELDDLLTIQRWSNYVDIFLKTGNPAYLSKLVSEDKKQSHIKNDGNQKIYEQIAYLVGYLNMLFEAVALCDTSEINRLVKMIYNELEEYKKIEVEFEFYPLVTLMGKISDKIEQLYDKNDSILILNIAEFYCLEFGQIQQGYTLLRELIISDAGKKLDVDINDRNIREGYISKILYEMGNRNNVGENSTKIYKSEALKINQDDEESGLELGKTFDKIIQKRNNLSHAGFSQETNLNYSRYANALKEYIKSLRRIYKITPV